MYVIETTSGVKRQIEIIPLDDGNFKLVTEDSYFFDWKTEKSLKFINYKLLGQMKY